MSRNEQQTTIAISRIHYDALLKLGAKNETFDHIVGNLLKNVKKDSQSRFGMTDTNVTLELSPKLQQEHIVRSYVYDLKTNSLVVELNHKYDKKTIISKIVKDDWTKTIEKFQGQMKQSGVSQRTYHYDH